MSFWMEHGLLIYVMILCFFFFGKTSLSDLVHPFDNSATLFLMKHVNAHLSTYSTCKSISYLAYRIFKNDKELG